MGTANNFRKAAIVLSLSMALAILLSAMIQSDQRVPGGSGLTTGGLAISQYGAGAGPLLVHIMLQVRPSDYPTPVPPSTPIATIGPTRGPVVSSNPAVTPPPAGRVNPTPQPTFYGKFRPGAVKTGPYSAPAVQKPLPTLIPQFPAKGIRTAPGSRV